MIAWVVYGMNPGVPRYFLLKLILAPNMIIDEP